MICDRFRLGELQYCVNGAPVVPRVSRWSEAAFDIRSLCKLAADGPLTVAKPSQLLLAASLSVALVKNDDQGNVRLSKKGSNNTARDDVPAGLALVAGAYARTMEKTRLRWQYRGMAG